MREGMWEKVIRRNHTALKVFPFGPNSSEAMLYGTVNYGLKDGREATVDWAARAHLVKQDGAVMMDFYQVYLVSLDYLFFFFQKGASEESNFIIGYCCTESEQVALAAPMTDYRDAQKLLSSVSYV